MAEEKVTEDQANQALRDILAAKTDLTEEGNPETATPAQQEATVTDAPVQAEGETTETAPPDDDVESLRKRLSDAEAAKATVEKEYQARLEAVQGRFSSNERILRDRYVRKSSVAERALQILRDARTDNGVDTAEVDRVIKEIEGSMNPASANYTPPQEMAASTEDQAIVLNNFLNEKGMSNEQAQHFASWIKGDASTALSPIEQAVAGRDLDGFLRIAHNRYNEVQKEQSATKQREQAAAAVKTVQKIQREAGKAASSSPSAPRKQPAGARAGEVDVKKLTKDDISALLRQSVEQYR